MDGEARDAHMRIGGAARTADGRRLRGYREELDEVFSDPLRFCSLLTIVDKTGKNIRLALNEEQRTIITSLHRQEGLNGTHKDVLILKPRQIGSTTAVAAYFFWRWLTAPGPETYVVLSHKISSSRHILNIHKHFYNSLPEPLKRVLSTDNGGEMKLADTGALLVAASAEGKGGLRSFTATGLHISEFAFSEDPEELKATALSALNGGQLCIESTANFYGDAMFKEIELYQNGLVDWDFQFFPWTAHLEYSLENSFPPGYDKEGPLTRGQYAWRVQMANRLGETKFRREYPLSLEDAYSTVEGSWITLEDLKLLTILVTEEGGEQLARVDLADRYAIGVDLGAGVGGDLSALVVVSVSTGQVVETRRSNSIPPIEFSEIIAEASAKWNGAKILVEENGTYGGIVITELRHLGLPQWTHPTSGKYWQTNGATKPMMLEHLKQQIVSGRITHLDTHIVGELRSFIINERGIAECPRSAGHHGDTVIALGLAIQCAKSIKIPDRVFLPQWVVKRSVDLARRAAGKTELRRY